MNKTKKKIILLAVALTVLVAVVCGVLYVTLSYLPEKRKEAELQEMVRAYYREKNETYQAENLRYADYEVDVAFLGDSLTDGYDLGRYYPQFTVTNRGIGGETTYGLLSRMQNSVYDLKPKVAVLLIGANNMDTMFETYEALLQGLKENLPHTKVVLLSLTSMGGEHWGRKNQLAAYNNAKIKLYAEKYGYTFVDLYTPLMNVETGEIYAEYTTDGGHLTHEGYTVLTAQITPVLTALLSAWQMPAEV